MSEYHGLILIDKPEGPTSHDVVARVRRGLGQRSVGHAGTLDPMATGLLVILCGRATKLSDYILSGDKAYQASVELGRTTDTDDVTGKTLEVSGTPRELSDLTNELVAREVESLQGVLELRVPSYSAVKVKGRKLYQMARQGVAVTPPKKMMNFQSVKLQTLNLPHQVDVTISCQKGGYIRSWARTLGERLETGGTLSALRRIESQPYSVSEAITLEDFEKGDWSAFRERGREIPLEPFFVPLSKCLPRWPVHQVEGLDEKLLVNGQVSRRLDRYLELQFGRIQPAVPGVKILSRRSGELLTLLSREEERGGCFRIRRVFPPEARSQGVSP